MNKNLKIFCITMLAPFIILGGCSSEQKSNFVMTAKIIAINSHIEIEIIKDDYNSGILWVNVPDSISILNKNGKKISLTDLAVGDKIEICYSGQVMMSYPGQITAQKITVLND